MKFRSLLVAASLLVSLPVFAQDDPSVKDHPGIPRFPGMVITAGVQQDFGAHEFNLGGEKMQRVEGRYWRIEYVPKEGGKVPGPLQMSRNYGNAFKKQGGVVLMEQVDSGGGQATMRMPAGGSTTWMEVNINNNGEQLTLVIVEEAPLEQKIELTAAAMASALAASGRVAVYGILFDTGKDAIKPESHPVLAEIATLLQGDPALKLRIEGHTDNVGKPADNVALSKRRADSVKRWLVAKGVADARLEAAGLGDTKPIAPNAGDDDRAKNRRVELVKK
jgi:outer membrane protein OmpA-like peptidoglycan-associated protein